MFSTTGARLLIPTARRNDISRAVSFFDPVLPGARQDHGSQALRTLLLRANSPDRLSLFGCETDDKIIAVHLHDPDYAHYSSVFELPPHRMREVKRFLRTTRLWKINSWSLKIFSIARRR